LIPTLDTMKKVDYNDQYRKAYSELMKCFEFDENKFIQNEIVVPYKDLEINDFLVRFDLVGESYGQPIVETTITLMLNNQEIGSYTIFEDYNNTVVDDIDHDKHVVEPNTVKSSYDPYEEIPSLHPECPPTVEKSKLFLHCEHRFVYAVYCMWSRRHTRMDCAGV
jgi:hypothetical protein